MSYPSKEVVQGIRDQYPSGTRVILKSMKDPYTHIPTGTKGTVECVDDIGTVFVNWDTGARLGIVYGEDEIIIAVEEVAWQDASADFDALEEAPPVVDVGMSEYQKKSALDSVSASLVAEKRRNAIYTIYAKIHRKRKVIGYILQQGKILVPYHIYTVLKLAKMGKINHAKVVQGKLASKNSQKLNLKNIPGGNRVLKQFEKGFYKVSKHHYREEYWGFVEIFNSTPIYTLVGTYRDTNDKLIGYKIFCPDTLDEYSLDLMETHQTISHAHITGEFGEHIQRGRISWDWRLYYTADEGFESIDALPREYMGKCKQATGGHLERDNIFQKWEVRQKLEQLLDSTAHMMACAIIESAKKMSDDAEK